MPIQKNEWIGWGILKFKTTTQGYEEIHDIVLDFSHV